jgi:ABC-2 type transport system ATP-binding protein
VIRTDGLTKRFGATVALDHLDLTVDTGEVFGFLGPNGAGKTTTIRLLLGLIRPTGGTASVLGLDPWSDVTTLHRRLAYVPGDFEVWPNLTGAETLTLLGRLHGSVDAVYQAELVDRFDLDVSKRGRHYSKGNRQKVALVAALATRAELLVLDEPTSGLDPLMEVTFRGCVAEAKERGQTVFLSSHILSEVEALCDRVGILRGGRLVDEGTLEDLRHLSARTLEVEFDGAPPDVAGIEGVDLIELSEGRLRCRIHGSPDPVVKALAHARVTSLVSREASLEDLFLSYYRDAV